FAIGDDIQASPLLIANRQQRGVVLRLFQPFRCNPPQFASTHSRRKTARQILTIDQPFRLGIGAHERGRQQHGRDFITNCYARISSRHNPRLFCAARSEKLKSTASRSARCATGRHEGTTKMSCAFQSNVWSPTWLLPLPSTAQKTVASVERYRCPAEPAGSHCRNAAMVGIGYPPVAGFAYCNFTPWHGSTGPLRSRSSASLDRAYG